jgi:hypothetical protein
MLQLDPSSVHLIKGGCDYCVILSAIGCGLLYVSYQNFNVQEKTIEGIFQSMMVGVMLSNFPYLNKVLSPKL